MENWEQEHEAIKADVNQLKDQMGQILAALESLKTTRESSSARLGENAHLYPSMFNATGQSVLFPMYGLPSGYIPPIGEHTEAEHASFSFSTRGDVPPIGTQGPVVISAPGVNMGTNAENPLEGIRVTARPHEVDKEDYSVGAAPNTKVVGGISSLIGAQSKLENLEARLRAVEGVKNYGFGDVERLSLVPGVKIPHKFKAPEFEKYNGSSCPKSHLTMFCRKMAAYAYDEQLFIHVFQDSLAGAALNWYTHLEPSRIRCWTDLADAFMKQYIYNMHVAPDRLQLQNMAKKDNETFKEYALRWRELAVQVEPPLVDKEMVAMFVNTLQPPFYEHMISSVSSNFADIVVIGERIEGGIRSGKIALGPNLIASLNEYGPRHEKDKERRTSPYVDAYPQMPHPAGSNRVIEPRNYNRKEKDVNFTPIPMTYTELLPNLLRNNLIEVCPTRPMRPPYPKKYDINATCDYHEGVCGHSTEACKALKHKVQSLIDSGFLKFEESQPDTGAGCESASTNAMDK